MTEQNIHLLYPKDSKAQNIQATEKIENKIETTDLADKNETNEPIALEILRTLIASIVFFFFFLFLGVGGIVFGDYYNTSSQNDILKSNNFTDESQIRNNTRINDLENIKKALNIYYRLHYQYPEASTIENEFKKENLITNLISDPLNTAPFKYAYAVYDNIIGTRQTYILSASLEDNNSNATLFTIGSPTIDHRDFRDIEKENIAYIPYEETETPKTSKVRR